MELFANSFSGYDKAIEFCTKQIVKRFFWKVRILKLDLFGQENIYSPVIKMKENFFL